MIGSASGSADSPRAHIQNMGALECLRDIGLEEECLEAATSGDCMLHTRWCRSMTGEEYARTYSWGNEPKRMVYGPASSAAHLLKSQQGDYDAASPCKHVDLPQTVLEPILVRRAILNGFTCRFDTTFLSFVHESPGTVLCELRDNLTGHAYRVRSKYLFGCDGARSQVLRQLEIPLIRKPGQGLAINVLVKVDLSPFVGTRMGNLHWVMQPEEHFSDFGWAAVVRMVRPWNEYVLTY